MASRVAFPGTILSGDSVSAADNNTLPGGVIGRVSTTSDSTGTTTVETIASCAVTANASRELSITVSGILQASTASGAQVTVLAAGSQIDRKNFYIAGAGSDYQVGFCITVHHRPSAGSITYAFQTGHSGSVAATITLKAASDQPAELIIRDEGPSF